MNQSQCHYALVRVTVLDLKHDTYTHTFKTVLAQNKRTSWGWVWPRSATWFQIWGLFGFCCQSPAKSYIWFCQELIVKKLEIEISEFETSEFETSEFETSEFESSEFETSEFENSEC